ncbi:MAG: galactose-1-phosphate uridylyltransferase [Mycobacteriales bacterium]
MRRTATRLADGRELVYFDDLDYGRVPRQDTRELEVRPIQAGLRWDPLTAEPVTVAAHRQTRTFLPSAAECPLCPGGEIPDARFDVAVFENRWPSFSGLAEGRPEVAAGRCEVLVFTDRHDGSLRELGAERARTVVEAWTDRSATLHQHPDIRYVACFENRGEDSGVTLHHPHGQIYGYPFVPPVIARIADTAKDQPDLFQRVLAAELSGPRVVVADEHWVGYVPEAARWPYELILMPRHHIATLEETEPAERASLSALLPEVLSRFDRLFDMDVPYIAGWRQSPRDSHDIRLHWRVFTPQRAAGRLKHLAGSETAYGAYINDVSPEDAAAALRRAAP